MRDADLQAAHDFSVYLDGGAQLAYLFVERVTLLEDGVEAETQWAFGRDIISWGSECGCGSERRGLHLNYCDPKWDLDIEFF